VLNSVQHLIIQDHKILPSCTKHFPNVKELTLSRECSLHSKWFQNNVIPLSQLTKLTLNIASCCLTDIVNILHVTPNVNTLIFQCIKSDNKQIKMEQKTDIFHLVSNQNRIKNVTITGDYNMSKIEAVVNLCRRLQHLTIGGSQKALKPSIRFLFSEENEATFHLSSFCVAGLNPELAESLKILILSTKVLRNYSIKFIDSRLYLWW
jgi:hypothetical protein